MTSNRHDSTGIQDILAESLQRHADPVSAGPGLAQAAHRRALRLRLQRRITAGVACLAVLAVGLPVGYNLLGGPAKTDIAPVETPTVQPSPRPTPSETQALEVTPSQPPERTTPPPERKENERKTPARVTIKLDELPLGDAPKVPWYERGILHDGDRTYPISDLEEESNVSFSPTAHGYLVQDSCCEGSTIVDTRTRLKNAAGKVIRTWTSIDNVIVSADGRRLAWAEPTPGGNDSANTFVVADAGTGEELYRKRIDQHYPTPVAFLGGSVVWDTDTADGGVTGLWDPESGKLSTVKGLGRTQDVHEQVLLANTEFDPEDPCPGLIDHARGDRKLWVTCDHALYAIAADGRYVFGEGRTTGVTVFDATDGKSLLEITAEPFIANWAAEPSGDLLFSVFEGQDNQRQALVRCTLDGECERATPIERVNGGTVFDLPRDRR